MTSILSKLLDEDTDRFERMTLERTFERVWGFVLFDQVAPRERYDGGGVLHACDVSGGALFPGYESGSAFVCGCDPWTHVFRCSVCSEIVGWCMGGSGDGYDNACDRCWYEATHRPLARRMLLSVLSARAGLQRVTYDARLGRHVHRTRRDGHASFGVVIAAEGSWGTIEWSDGTWSSEPLLAGGHVLRRKAL